MQLVFANATLFAYTSPERLIGLKTLSPARTLSQQRLPKNFPKLVVTTPLVGLRSIPGTILLALEMWCSGATNYLSTVSSSPITIVNCKSEVVDCWRPQGDSNPCYRRERAMS
jgi:hypothetical protein